MVEKTIMRKLNEVGGSNYILNNGNNIVYIVGTLSYKAEKCSIAMYGENFYDATISVKRLSDEVDNVPVMFSERLLSDNIDVGSRVEIIGEFRSYNQYDTITQRSRLILNVFVKNLRLIEPTEDIQDENMIYLDGFICKDPIYRTTPLGKEIADILLAVNRKYGKSSYIPCVLWGRNARFFGQLPISTNIGVYGRIQSRKYTKKIGEDKEIEREAIEVSVSLPEVIQYPEVTE